VNEGRRPNQTRKKRRPSKAAKLTVSKILRQSAAYAHSLEVRAQAPALVLILEVDAPLRLEPLFETEREEKRLLDELAANDVWHRILAAFEMARALEEGSFESADVWRRSEDHARRLAEGQKIKGAGRVTGTLGDAS
jgi:hypothetical protein